ncbi:MAG: alpha/beta fold hydrolase [Kouleothrix sp.]|jgi:proline iminopeptidase|nr:alpha/beta fold hydrolase [Kouleothrix sp.]
MIANGLDGRHVPLDDTQLYVVERGQGYPIIVLHGGPGLDHHMFGDYLDPLADHFRLLLVDQRSQGRSARAPADTWTLARMARDVGELAHALGLARYAVLGHSYGAFVALQHAANFPGQAAQTIVSSGLPSARFLAEVDTNLAHFEPAELREQVASSWAREQHAQSQADMAAIMHDQFPFHFADPRDPRIAELEARSAGTIYAPDVLRQLASQGYGGIELESRLGAITQPLLVLAGRHDRTCSVAGAEAIVQGAPHAELVVFEHSGHMTYVEENQRYLATVREFLLRHGA